MKEQDEAMAGEDSVGGGGSGGGGGGPRQGPFSTARHRPTVEIGGQPLSDGFPVNRLRLEVTEGNDEGKKFATDQPIIRIGADILCDLVLSDPTVSRNHAEVRQRGEKIVLVDLDSTNGTFIDDEAVEQVPLRPGQIFRVGRTKIRVERIREKLAIKTTEDTRYDNIIGQSQALREIFSIMDRVAPSELSVVIEGETGSGKELIARAIHEHSRRKGQPFVVFDCSAFPANLLESQLFGHEKGAFTGAVKRHRGVFERANGGTIFFDELGELDMEFQAKFLRVLETGEFRPVGSEKTVSTDVRVVCATNRDLEERIAEGEFRRDLFYRLAQVRFRLPPLRERVEDIPLLVEHFLEAQAERTGAVPRMAADAHTTLQRYSWPGNIRELRNVVEKAVAMCAGSHITADYLRGELRVGHGGLANAASAPSPSGPHPSVRGSFAPAAGAPAPGVTGAQINEGEQSRLVSLRPGHIQVNTRMLRDDDSIIPFKDAKDAIISEFEKRYIELLLERCEENVSKAARVAQVDRRHFYRLLKKHDFQE